MFLYGLARKVNARRKIYLKKQAGRCLSPVRRIEFVAPPSKGRFCAMTFDDGPCALPPSPGGGDRGLTQVLLDILEEYGAKGTFDVIGDTAGNYPDEEGKAGDFSWSGVHYDHYPRFQMDGQAGAVNQPQLIARMLQGGHEITNHSYTHRLFGPMRAVYGARRHFDTLDQVVDDLDKLDRFLRDEFGYQMKLSRPPHYIDKIPGGGTAYDAYRILGYQYMAASFDGGGWLPAPTYEQEVEAMITPLRQALEQDPDCMNGRIIFQKDGCSMNLRTPIAGALEAHLQLLREYGYQVVTVSQLMALCPFEDLGDRDPACQAAKALLELGHTVGYRNNTFQGARPATLDEVRIMACPPQVFSARRAPMSYQDCCAVAQEYWKKQGLFTSPGRSLGSQLLDAAMKSGAQVDEALLKVGRGLSRQRAVLALAPICQAMENI